MTIEEIKAGYSERILQAMTEKDKSGRGYVCPVCGSGSGQNGTGLRPVPNQPGYYHCFAAGCPFEHGDILELVGQTYHISDTAGQIEKAGQLAGLDFSNKKAWYEDDRKAGSKREGNKNMVENTDKTNTVTNGAELLKERENIKNFIEAAAAALPKSPEGLQYLAMRGITQETAARYKLGYVANYGDGMGTPALIIPTGKYSYTARSITSNESSRKVRKKKAGDKAGVFGIWVMKKKLPAVFVVEGEIDAISIMQEGLPAIATGGGTSKRAAVEEMRKYKGSPTTFLIIPDNDRKPDGSPDTEKGLKAGQDILQELQAEGIRAEMLDILDPDRWPQNCKDCNEFMTRNPETFRAFLDGIKNELEEKELGRVSGYLQEFVQQIAGNTPPIATGFNALDKILGGGLHPGLITIGAISSLGKTTFCLNMADMMATAGQDVLFYSLEMSRFELIAKIISRRTALTCLQNGKPLNLAKTNLGVSDFDRWAGYNPAEKKLLQDCMNNFATGGAQRLYIREGMQNIGTERIRQDIQKHEFFTGRRPVVVVDYVQILKTPDLHMTDKQAVDANVVELKRISRDYNTPVIGISSFNRDNYKEPVNMSAFKESGALEYTSDVLIGLQFDGMDYMDGEKDAARTARIRGLFKDNETAARQGKAVYIQAKILKNRSGGKTDCIFNYFPMFNLYLESK